MFFFSFFMHSWHGINSTYLFWHRYHPWNDHECEDSKHICHPASFKHPLWSCPPVPHSTSSRQPLVCFLSLLHQLAFSTIWCKQIITAGALLVSVCQTHNYVEIYPRSCMKQWLISEAPKCMYTFTCWQNGDYFQAWTFNIKTTVKIHTQITEWTHTFPDLG